MNKILVILFSYLLFTFHIFSYNVEIKTGCQTIKIEDYNDRIFEINKIVLLPNYTGESEKTLAEIAGEISVIFKLNNFLDFYPKLWFLSDVIFMGKYYYPDGSKFMDYDSNILFIYSGVGFNLNYYYNNNFLFYCGADAGLQTGIGNNKIVTYTVYGDEADYINKQVNYYDFGFFVKVGLKYFLLDNFGILIECNYNNVAENMFMGIGMNFLIQKK